MSHKLHTLLRDVEISCPEGLVNPELTLITTDSRKVISGCLFVGLPGTKVDGGIFWRNAIAAGASAAIIGQAAAQVDPPSSRDPVLVLFESVALKVGQLISSFWDHPSRKMGLIGVTGTNGKTTTTHLIEHLACSVGCPTALFGTLVNRWKKKSVSAIHTTSFSDQLQAELFAAAEAGSQLVAMEVSSHALDQHRIAGCRFAGAVFTNLTQDHLDYHPSMEDYFEAKATLFAEPLLTASSAAVAVVNSDDPWGARLARRLGNKCWSSSLIDTTADIYIKDIQITNQGLKGFVVTPFGEGMFSSSLLGRFNLMNILQALGILIQQNLPLPQLLDSICSFPGVPGRMELVLLNDIDPASHPRVLVDYAHTPDGLKNALVALRHICKGRLICVFGCGGNRDRGKRPQMAAIAGDLADLVVVTSDNPRNEDPQQIIIDILAGIPAGTDWIAQEDRAEAISVAINSASPKDLILVAGKGHEDYQILGSKKVRFSDREEVEKVLLSLL